MKVTAIEEYGLRCLLRVLSGTEDEPVSAQTIAQLEGMSVPHTQKILRILGQGGLVESKRGVNGGYYATLSPEEVSLGDVMRVLGGFLEVEGFCDRYTGARTVCINACNCSIRPIWGFLSDHVMRTMDRIPLSLLSEDEITVRHYLAGLDSAGMDLVGLDLAGPDSEDDFSFDAADEPAQFG